MNLCVPDNEVIRSNGKGECYLCGLCTGAGVVDGDCHNKRTVNTILSP